MHQKLVVSLSLIKVGCGKTAILTSSDNIGHSMKDHRRTLFAIARETYCCFLTLKYLKYEDFSLDIVDQTVGLHAIILYERLSTGIRSMKLRALVRVRGFVVRLYVFLDQRATNSYNMIY